MRVLLTLLAKDFANLRRNRGALVLSLIVPAVIIYIVGWVWGLHGGGGAPTGIPLAVVNQSDNPAAAKLVAALQAEKSFDVRLTTRNADHTTRPLTEEDLRPMIRDRQFHYALVIPPDVISDSRLGLHLRILADPVNQIEDQIVSGILQKTIFSNVPQLLGQSLQARAKKFLGGPQLDTFNRSIVRDVTSAFGGDPDKVLARVQSGDFGFDRLLAGSGATPGAPGASADDGGVFSRIVMLDREQVVGKDVKSPKATQIIGGYAVMFLLFALSNSAAAFFEEKNTGVFQRLLAGPVSRGQLLWSRFFYGVLFGLIQLSALFLTGRILYGVDVFGHAGTLVLACTCVAAACTGFGMLLATITSSAQAANSLATLLVITMSACGGAWFPISMMPRFMQQISHFTLVYWSIEAFNAVLWAGNGLADMVPILGVLVGFAMAAMAVAVWRFNRSRIFE